MKTTKNHLSILFLCSGSILLLINWGTPETSVDGEKKQSINFYGSLVTHQNAMPIKIDNISIDNKSKQIPMYEKPSTKQPSKMVNNGTTRQEIMLDVDPRTELVTTKIDLSEVNEIEVPEPSIVWTYKKEKGYRKTEYLEVIIISNNEQKTKASYLLDLRTKIYCDEINTAGPIEKIVPLQAIKQLKIDGYKYRSQTVPCQKSETAPSCPACPSNQPIESPVKK
jgi:hypothetical protein